MAQSGPVARRRARHLLIAAPLLLASLLAAGAARTTFSEDDLPIDYVANDVVYSRDGSVSMRDLELTYGRDRDIRLTASRGTIVERDDGEWLINVEGQVHIQFRDAVIDGDSGSLVLRSEVVESATIRGTQSTFSHQPRGASRRFSGQADAVEYSASTADVRLVGHVLVNYGRAEVSSDPTDFFQYNLTTGVARDDGDPATRVRGTLRPRNAGGASAPDRIPPPRTPDRETAQ